MCRPQGATHATCMSRIFATIGLVHNGVVLALLFKMYSILLPQRSNLVLSLCSSVTWPQVVLRVCVIALLMIHWAAYRFVMAATNVLAAGDIAHMRRRRFPPPPKAFVNTERRSPSFTLFRWNGKHFARHKRSRKGRCMCDVPTEGKW